MHLCIGGRHLPHLGNRQWPATVGLDRLCCLANGTGGGGGVAFATTARFCNAAGGRTEAVVPAPSTACLAGGNCRSATHLRGRYFPLVYLNHVFGYGLRRSKGGGRGGSHRARHALVNVFLIDYGNVVIHNCRVTVNHGGVVIVVIVDDRGYLPWCWKRLRCSRRPGSPDRTGHKLPAAPAETIQNLRRLRNAVRQPMPQAPAHRPDEHTLRGEQEAGKGPSPTIRPR